MQESLTTMALVLAITTSTAQASCLRAIDGNVPRQKPIEAPCQTWKQMVASLSESERKTLLREGAVRKSGIGWILSDSLVPDCQIPIEMAAYFARVVGGGSEDQQDDRKFAADNSKEIVRVLRSLWPSLGNSKALVLMADGAFDSEKYALLAEPAFEQDVIAPLISDILEKEGVSSELAFVLMSRPMPEMKAAITRQLTLSEGKGDAPRQVYALVLLHRLGEPTALPKLKKLSENKNLSAFEKKLIPALLAKIRRGEVIKFSDIEDLDYENNRRNP
jgi:hypothetical protein